MKANQRATSEVESRFPVRVRIGIPPGGLGRRLDQMNVWLDANCGADGRAITPSGSRGIVNDVVAIYFADATLASAFVARWCVGGKAESVDGRIPEVAGFEDRLRQLLDKQRNAVGLAEDLFEDATARCQ
jgi:hypothetical protein